MMHPVMLFNSAAFLINTYCDGSMDLSNHDPFFDQLKFYYPWCFWYFFCSCYLQLVLMMMMMMMIMMNTLIDCSSMPKNKIQVLTSKFKADHWRNCKEFIRKRKLPWVLILKLGKIWCNLRMPQPWFTCRRKVILVVEKNWLCDKT